MSVLKRQIFWDVTLYLSEFWLQDHCLATLCSSSSWLSR